jgi:hypothetical protein
VRKLLLSIVILSAVVSTDIAAQQPGSAGATRPKLRVLQALPESQLFLVMNLVSDSLGVRCDYCHVQVSPDLTRTPSNVGGWVWDRDDKPQKLKAREMMRMVVALNAESFKGESRITCYTCHRGSTVPARTPPLPPADAGGRTRAAVTLPSADRVWTNYVNAVGRVDAQPAGTGMVLTGWDERSEGRYGKLEIILGGADRYRATVSTTDTILMQGLDAEGGWANTSNGPVRFSGPDLARLRRIAARYRPVKERPANLQVVGLDRVADRDVYIATAKRDPVTTTTLYFDVVTGLLRRELTITETMLVPLVEQADYDDYRDVSGVQLPFRVQTSDGSPYGTVTKTFMQIRRNVAVDEAQFRPPSGGK